MSRRERLMYTMCQRAAHNRRLFFGVLIFFSVQIVIIMMVNVTHFSLIPRARDGLEDGVVNCTGERVAILNSTWFKVERTENSVIKRLEHIANIMRVREHVCSYFFNYSVNQSEAEKLQVTKVGTVLDVSFYVNATCDCNEFQRTRGYIMSSLTKEEEEFPLAYSLIVYKDVEMVERLFRTIYRPQNYYCFHVDAKSPIAFYRAVAAIVQCFPNAFMASRRVNVTWGEFSVLEPDLMCMEELYRFRKWKYFINLTGQEFPLKTNYELVKILKAYNGAVDVFADITEELARRWKKTLPPHGLRPFIGPVHIVVHRLYVDYILHNETAKSLLDWVKTTEIPDETFFAILNANPKLGIKGTFTGRPDKRIKPFIGRYKNWKPLPCAGNYVRGICILSTGDLPRLGAAVEMFANKFFLEEDRLVIGCLEEKLFNDTRDEFSGKKIFDTTYYANLDFVKNQVT